MKVAIVGRDYEIHRMFVSRGFKIVAIPDADLIQFTGGSDVDPSYYNEEKHASTYSDPRRDAIESNIFRSMDLEGKKFAGICRGGQFLNVMNGGKMWQDINNHSGSHVATIEGKDVIITSTHHQMMNPSAAGKIVGTAKRSTYRDTALVRNEDKEFLDIEAVVYPNSVCFQPHPEYGSATKECEDSYFQLLEKYLGIKAG